MLQIKRNTRKFPKRPKRKRRKFPKRNFPRRSKRELPTVKFEELPPQMVGVFARLGILAGTAMELEAKKLEKSAIKMLQKSKDPKIRNLVEKSQFIVLDEQAVGLAGKSKKELSPQDLIILTMPKKPKH